ncbi:hypothetical protein WDU94_006874 [Cyamophila willieti]
MIRGFIKWSVKRLSSFHTAYTIFQLLGCFPLNKFNHPPWKYRLHRLYMWIQYVICISFIVVHFLNTCFRSAQYMPEFIQCLYEDVVFICFLLGIICLRRDILQFENFLHLLDTTFSKAHTTIVKDSRTKAMKTCFVFLGFYIMTGLGIASEFLWPISDTDLKIRTKVYHTKYPRRKLLLNIWIPGIDETEPWNFWIMFIWQLYMFLMLTIVSLILLTIFPLVVIEIQAQVKILCNHLQKLGSPHNDHQGNRILYTNIEKNQFVIVTESNGHPYTGHRLMTKYKKQKHTQNQWSMQAAYEQHYFKQIIKFHQKILAVINNFVKTINSFIIIVVLGNHIGFVLTLYQLINQTTHMSGPKLFKFLCEYLLLVGQYYAFCVSSEMVDDFHKSMRTAVANSKWFTCSRSTRNDIRMLLLRLHKPNYPKFCNDWVVLCKPGFAGLLRLSYNVVNLLLLKSQAK